MLPTATACSPYENPELCPVAIPLAANDRPCGPRAPMSGQSLRPYIGSPKGKEACACPATPSFFT